MVMKDLSVYILEHTNLFDRLYINRKYKTYSAEKYELLKLNQKLKDAYKGKRCFIIGNGPSVNKCDLSLLKNEYTFTVNQFPRNNQYENLNPNFHMWADERFFDIDKNRKEDMELIDVMKKVNTTSAKPLVFYKVAAKKIIKEFNLDHEIDIAYFDDLAIIGGCKKIKDIDFTKPVPRFSTVCHYLICLAVYMGFSEIYILGCDCTGFVTLANTYDESAGNYQYAYEMTENEKKRLKRNNMKCSIQNELKWYANIFDEYEHLFEYCERHNVKLYNATVGGVLSSIPRVKFETLFN